MADRSSVLIVRLGALGDIVHAMPVAGALRDAWPDCRIGWLVQQPYAGLVGLVREVDQVHALTRPFDLAALRAVRAVRYDICLDLQGLIKSAAYARASGARRVIGFSRALLREPLARLAYGETGGVPGGHVIAKNLSLLRRLGIEAAMRPIALAVPETPIVDGVRELLGRLPSAGSRREPAAAAGTYVLLNPGAGWPNKRWPPERFGQLAARVLADCGLPSVVLWGPGEDALAATVVQASGGAAVMAPQSGMGDVLALARSAAVVVSGDTGPLHLAAAVGTPIVGLYGPTPAERNGPWDPADRCVSRHDQCRCIFKRRCTAATWCLGTITVHEVAVMVAARLAPSL
jgi:heptosyltransferase I